MATETKCDRCGKIIEWRDERIFDYLKETYPGMDICESCDAQITIVSACAKDDALNNAKPGTALRRMAENYGILEPENKNPA